MKGIILAGGAGTRLHPATKVMSKQLLPVYDKPMIYYPLSALMLAGIRDILVISTPRDIPHFQELLEDGSSLGISIQYASQPKPEGIAQAFIIGENFIQNQPCCLILGDNIFHGAGFSDFLQEGSKLESGGMVFGYWVKDPERYGVVEFEKNGHVSKIVEKPQKPMSNFAVTGMYFFDKQVCEIAKSLKPSARGELEIIDVVNVYLQRGQLSVIRLPRGMAWLDTGTHESYLQASNYIQTIEERQGLKVGCLEEIAFRMKFISKEQLLLLSDFMKCSSYGKYLQSLVYDD